MTLTHDRHTTAEENDDPDLVRGLQSQAAAELGQELTLVARAMFAHLLPDAGSYALSGVPLGGAVPPTLVGAEVAPHHATPVDVRGGSTVEASDYSVDALVHEGAAVALPAHEATPQPSVPVTGVPVSTPGEASTPAPVVASVGSSVPVPQLEVPSVQPAGSPPAVAVPTTPQPDSVPLQVPSVAVPSLNVPGEATPIPSLAVPDEPDETSVHDESLAVPEAVPDVSSRSSHRPDRSMAMLAEIGFLDE